MLFLFPGDVLDEIMGLVESVSEGFPTYSCKVYITLSNYYGNGDFFQMLPLIRCKSSQLTL